MTENRKDYGLVNAWNSAGEWLGFFMNKEAATSWLKNNGHDLKLCEVSNRRFIRETKTEETK